MVARVLAGDLSAFEPLVLPYRRTLFGLAYKMTGNREDALEVSQETLLRVFRYLGRCDLERGFQNWVIQILINAARDLGGKKRRESGRWNADSFLENAVSEEPRPEEVHDRSEIRGRIMSALSVLSEREREVFILRDLEEKSVRETAEITRSSAISVRVHLSRARGKIRNRLAVLDPSLPENAR
ncbi:MAG: RNA polymerase sigma factor [Candidatus Aminicenantes bacterium]|nr:RNA polymerase sigma factor [Candidatus Aminicenantes bacterium]